MSISIAFLLKRDNIRVKNTEKPTFLILKDDSILRTAPSESRVNSLKFEHLSNQRTKTTLWLVRDTYLSTAIWLVRDTYPKQSDWCDIEYSINAKYKVQHKRVEYSMENMNTDVSVSTVKDQQSHHQHSKEYPCLYRFLWTNVLHIWRQTCH